MHGFTDHEKALAADSGMHARLAQGLRDAARFIENHPDLPIPFTVEIRYCIPGENDKYGEDEAYRIAEMIGSTVTGDDFSSETERGFGPAVSYSAVYVNKAQMASYREHMASWARPGKAEVAA